MLTILSFIRILHLKQQYFFRLEFGKTLFSNKFFSWIFRSKMTVHTIEKDQIKYFAYSQLGKIIFFYVQYAAAINYVYSSLWSFAKRLFSQFRKLQGLQMYQILNSHHVGQNTSSKHKNTTSKQKLFNIYQLTLNT